MIIGKVKWFNFKKGYGFIQPEDGSKDVFVHKTALKSSGIDNLEEGQDITFEIADENENSIVITEINYSSYEKFDSVDWVEIYNTSKSTIDLNGWSFKDNDNRHTFIFDNNTILEPGAYMVLSNDLSKIKSKFSNLKQLLGPFEFGGG